MAMSSAILRDDFPVGRNGCPNGRTDPPNGKRKAMAHGKELFENLDMLIDQTNDKLSSFANDAVYVQISPMPFGHNVIGQAQA